MMLKSNYLILYSIMKNVVGIIEYNSNVLANYLLNIIIYLDEDVSIEGLIQVKISKFLQILLELSNFVKHCEYLLSEIHCQFINVFEFQLITADIHFQVKNTVFILVNFSKSLTSLFFKIVNLLSK